jgi:hypothetical protein
MKDRELTEAEKAMAASMPRIMENEYSSLKKAADLIACCPHVIPAGIGIEQYFEELKKGDRWLNNHYIGTGRDMAAELEKIASNP